MFTGSFESLYVGLAKKIEAVPDGRAVNRRSGGLGCPQNRTESRSGSYLRYRQVSLLLILSNFAVNRCPPNI